MDIQLIQQPNNQQQLQQWLKQQISIVVPYIHGLGERLKRTCNNFGNQVHFRGTNTIKTLLMIPKEKDNKLQKSVVIYRLNAHTSTAQRNI